MSDPFNDAGRYDKPPDYGTIALRLTRGLNMAGAEIAEAPDVVGISVTVLTLDAGQVYTTDDAGNLVILGELTYRPVRFDQDGRVIVCERVQ